jgi:hypothetical protein
MSFTKNYLSFLIVFISFIFNSCKKEEVTSISIDKPTLAILVGQTDTLFSTITATGEIDKFPITWESSNSSIVRVNDKGIIIGVAVGTVNITVRAGGKFVSSTVTSSSEFSPSFNQAFLVYYGDTLHTTVSNLFLLQLRNNTEILEVLLNVNLLATDSLPSGKYNVLTSINSLKDLTEYTIIPGWINGYTTYYSAPQSMFGFSKRPIETGNIVVTPTKNGYYKINYIFKDATRTFIYGVYNGPLEYYNYKKTKSNSNCIDQSVNKLPIKIANFKIANF